MVDKAQLAGFREWIQKMTGLRVMGMVREGVGVKHTDDLSDATLIHVTLMVKDSHLTANFEKSVTKPETLPEGSFKTILSPEMRKKATTGREG